VTPEEARNALDALLIEGYLREQCACGCAKEHHELKPKDPHLGFCHVCWSDNCNYYRPVLVETNKLRPPQPELYTQMTRELLRRRGRGGAA